MATPYRVSKSSTRTARMKPSASKTITVRQTIAFTFDAPERAKTNRNLIVVRSRDVEYSGA